MNVAVTGASGHLGSYVCQRLRTLGHGVQPIGREFPALVNADVIWHLAAPNHRDVDACREFMWFNDDVLASRLPVINAGTWWQYADGETADLDYVKLKHVQEELFGTTLILFSVYGQQTREGRGFVPQLIDHANGGKRLAGASRQPRDWVHVEDVFAAFLAASTEPPGVYDVATYQTFSPHELVLAVTGEPLPNYEEFPNCAPQYVNDGLKTWAPRMDVLFYTRSHVNEKA